MLYIFHVDTGTTITFDIKLALQSVAQLKEAIERECGVFTYHQVLLMSGGESLEPNARVCSYSAGTDTNPIYLFSKAAIESHVPPAPSIDYGSGESCAPLTQCRDVDLQSQIDASLAMPATYQTLVARAHLAQQCCGLAREQTRICERLVHDQHLQQQGWAAVVANLEDITQMFQTRSDLLQQSFTQYIADRQRYMELLENFNSDLGTLAKIPILPALRPHAEGLVMPDDQEATNYCEQDTCQQGADSNEPALSLLRWISAKDNQSSLEQVAEQCSRGLEQFDERVMESLRNEVKAAIDSANKKDMKEIKGLGERLFALEQLMDQTKKLVHEQGELAQGFLQNQNRANNLGDASVLPDLCTSHRRQLLVMLQNHNQLRDIRRRCTKAKEELSVNIYHRLKWIMYVENKMMEVDGKLVMYHESLKRLKRHLEVLQQIHLAPQMYVSAVSEVVRRRTFSQAFLVWASNLACQLLTVHSEEIARRREFQSKFDGHFLNTLFPGLGDTPPPFATQAPSVFDNGLPKLTVDDMESLRVQIPDLALAISTPDLSGITQFFLSKSLADGSTDESKEKDGISMHVGVDVDVNVNVNADVDTNPATDLTVKEEGRAREQVLADRACFESETDTEEFEKIGQGASDSKCNSFDGTKEKRREQYEENLGNTREEAERLRSILKTMKMLMSDALSSMRNELTAMREQSNVNRGDLAEMTERIRQALSLYSDEYQRCFRKREQELTVDHELEVGDLKKQMNNQEDEFQALKRILAEKQTELAEHERLLSTMRQKLEEEQAEMRNLRVRLKQLEDTLEQARADKESAVKKVNDERFSEIAALTNSLAQCQKRTQELEESLVAARTDHQRAVKEAMDKLQIEHKTELDTIRSRFKLMTASTMERSPSDSSLEKIERQDVIDLVHHEAVLAQTKEDMKAEKSLAIRTAVEKERANCVAKLDHELRLSRQVVAEKRREIEMYKIKEVALTEACTRYKNAIRRLMGSDNAARRALDEKVENLEAEITWLESQIMSEGKILDQKEGEVLMVEVTSRKDLADERLDGNLKDIPEASGFESDDIEVSGSKKVRLEDDDNLTRDSRKVEILESDNKRLTNELHVLRESKEAAEAKVEALEIDKIRLEIELVKERAKRGFPGELSSSTLDGRDKEMNASVAVVSESSRDAATSPEPCQRSMSTSCFHSSWHVRKKITKNAAKLVQQGHITVTTCNPGDIVLVLWDAVHRNYALFQETSTPYFLNPDSVVALDLTLNADGTPKRLQTVAEVVTKEYCLARKSENRYRVPIGTKFYRVRVKSVDKDIEAAQLVVVKNPLQ